MSARPISRHSKSHRRRRVLSREAADEATIVNALANSILDQHFEWDKKASEFGFVSLHKPVFMSESVVTARFKVNPRDLPN